MSHSGQDIFDLSFILNLNSSVIVKKPLREGSIPALVDTSHTGLIPGHVSAR